MRVLRLAFIAMFLAGCGGGGGHSALLPSAGGSAAATPPAKGTVKLTIAVPKSTGSNARRPAYVSPATQSMTVNVTGTGTTATPTGFPITVGLTPSSAGCTSSLAGTICTQQLSLGAGTYNVSVSTFDGTGGTGNELSTGQNVPFTVVANQNNSVALTLSGIPAQLDLTYPGNLKFNVVALDADNNYIVGAGAPTFTVAKASGANVATITQPTTAAPNAFSLAAANSGGSETLTVTAGYPAGETSGCTQTGAVCTTSFSVAASQYLFTLGYYGVSDSTGAVAAFTVPFTSNSVSAAFTYNDYYPYGGNIAIDQNNGNLFFSGYDYDSSYPFYEVAAPYTGGEVSLGSGYVSGMAVDSNHNLFVSNYDNDSVSEYASPYTGSPVKTFGLDYPFGLALDANNDLFVGNYDYEYVTEYPYSNGSYGSAVQIPSNGEPLYVAIDPNGNLWAYSEDDDTVQEFKPPFSAASTPALTITGTDPNEYCESEMVFDSSGDLFVMNDSEYIDEYTASQISAGGTIASSSASAAMYAGDGYACFDGFDASGNLYATTYYYSSLFADEGGVLEFSPPFSSSSTPVHSVSMYYPYYNSGVISKSFTLSVTL